MREQKDRYEIFLKVCETGSFSKAAEALNYTQSGISQMMAGLEICSRYALFFMTRIGLRMKKLAFSGEFSIIVTELADECVCDSMIIMKPADAGVGHHMRYIYDVSHMVT